MATAQELKQQILNRKNLVETVAKFVRLRRAGVNYLGLCPFHQERTPSFTVSPAKQIYKCFGCGATGDAITFLREHEKLGYMEALHRLAQLENIPVSYEPEKKHGEEQRYRESLSSLKTVPRDVLSRSLRHYQYNAFAVWLSGLVGWETALQALVSLYAGTSKGWGTIWWQVDQFMRVRTGQKLHYGADGHRLKDVAPKRLFLTDKGYKPCLFGEHQLLEAPAGVQVAVVESEKTALLCTLWQPLGTTAGPVVYLGSSGVNGLTDEKIWPLKGMRVCLMPDYSFVSRATWGVCKMRKKENEKGKMIPHPDGEVQEDYVSVAQRLGKLGCEVTFFDPYPEVQSGTDIGDYLVGLPLERSASAAAAQKIEDEQPFE